MKDKNELMRQLIDLAISSGKKRQNPQTGLIHHFYGAQEGETHVSVPIIENLLFVLALLKSRTMENVAEAKEILNRLLYFQNRQEDGIAAGNFPIYIHEYPTCKDRFVSAHVSLVLYWILKQFQQILGQPLKEQSESALKCSIRHALQSQAEKSAPYPIALKIAASAKATGTLLQEAELERSGDVLLSQLQKHPDHASWMCPAALGTMLLALSAVYPDLSTSPWATLWKYLDNTWHRQTGCYTGPGLKEWQLMSEPQPTIYDLYMGYLSGAFSARVLKDSPLHLEAALITANETTFPEPAYPLQLNESLGNASWTMYHDRNIAYCILQKDQAMIHPAAEKGYHLLRMLWGDLQRVHTFVCPGGDYQQVVYKVFPEGFNMNIELGAPPAEDEEREKTREIAFYGDIHEGLGITTSGEKATTFLIGDEVIFQSKTIRVVLQFGMENGDGKFIGHRMFYNRPSQVGAKGIHRYETYDWTVFLRTLERTEKCTLNIAIGIEENPEE